MSTIVALAAAIACLPPVQVAELGELIRHRANEGADKDCNPASYEKSAYAEMSCMARTETLSEVQDETINLLGETIHTLGAVLDRIEGPRPEDQKTAPFPPGVRGSAVVARDQARAALAAAREIINKL